MKRNISDIKQATGKPTGETEKNTEKGKVPETEKGAQGTRKSYHTFLFPFIYADSRLGIKTIDDFEKKLLRPECRAGKPGDGNREEQAREAEQVGTPEAPTPSQETRGDVVGVGWEAEAFSGARNADTEPWQSKAAEYNVTTYFNDATLRALGIAPSDASACGGKEQPICKNYCLRHDEDHELQYVISAPAWEDEGSGEDVGKPPLHRLKVNAIRLSVFNTGVAILRIEVENPFTDNLEIDETLTKVHQINEWGRRLFSPYVTLTKVRQIEESPHVTLGDDEAVTTSDMFKRLGIRHVPKEARGSGRSDEAREGQDAAVPGVAGPDAAATKTAEESEIASTDLTAEALRAFFGPPQNDESEWDWQGSALRGSDSSNQGKIGKDTRAVPHLSLIRELILGKTRAGESTWQPTPAIDDRMFVACCIRDQRIPDYFRGATTIGDRHEGQYAYQRDAKVADHLYALINIDAPVWPSSQNKNFTQADLDRQLYTRWIDAGTIHAVTPYSMFLITGESPKIDAPVVNPFLTQYIPMATLTLAQRASLIHFDRQLTGLAARFARSGANTAGREQASNEKDLVRQADTFARFQGELVPEEVTPQIQGIEIYAKLQDMLFIEKLNDGANRQMTKLFEINEARFNRDVSDTGNTLAVLAGGIGLFALAFEFGNQFETRPEVSDGLQPFIMGFYVFLMTFSIAAGAAVAVTRSWKIGKKVWCGAAGIAFVLAVVVGVAVKFSWCFFGG